MDKNTLSFFSAYASLILICFINIVILLSPISSINGEIVYTCGFFLVLYVIWVEAEDTINTNLKSQFGFSQISLFWFKYRELERSILLLVDSKIRLVRSILFLFTLVSAFLKIVILVQFKIFEYKILLQLLNKTKLKTKSLPLQ